MRCSVTGWPGGRRPWCRPRCAAGWPGWRPGIPTGPSPRIRWSGTPSGRLVLDAAGTAAETALAGLPAGTVTSRADALRVVEVIELLLDAGQWQPADDMYTSRSGRPEVWKTLPAARLGQRAATAFVATPARRAACATQLSPARLGFYLDAVGLFAMNAGDLATAREYLPLAVRHDRDAGDMANLAIGLRNLAECLGQLGQPGPARDAAAEALTCAETAGDREHIRNSHAYLGWLAGLAGDAAAGRAAVHRRRPDRGRRRPGR